MKKLISLTSLVLLCLLKVNAQEPQLVSTEAANRNVLIEEFTGRNCGYCPWGQSVVNDILKDYPGRVFTVNIHPQGNPLSPTSYPNLGTIKGADIVKAFDESGALPQAVINRSTEEAVGLYTTADRWRPMTNEQLGQVAECNIAGQVTINPETRLARITVEVYYTADSKAENNYLTVIMLQDSIIGSQSGAADNPSQVVGNQYCHMHVYRNTITDKWGDAISPTTTGTLITKTFKYTIPEKIGEPNGVVVDLNNIHFLAFVTQEQTNGAKTMPILNVCELENVENTTAVEDMTEASYSVYPNPVKDEINVTSKEMIEEVTIYNINGQQTTVNGQQSSSTGMTINVSNLNPGVYFIKVNDKVQKFIKQ